MYALRVPTCIIHLFTSTHTYQPRIAVPIHGHPVLYAPVGGLREGWHIIGRETWYGEDLGRKDGAPCKHGFKVSNLSLPYIRGSNQHSPFIHVLSSPLCSLIHRKKKGGGSSACSTGVCPRKRVWRAGRAERETEKELGLGENV